jgi:exopolysaccharide production protein ExoY
MDAPLKPQHSAMIGVEQTEEGLLEHAAQWQAADMYRPAGGPHAASRLAHFLLLLPPLQGTRPEWFPSAGCVLSWQLRWLRAHAASITLVADQDVLARLSTVMATLGDTAPRVALCPWNRLPRHAPTVFATQPSAPVVVMAAPFLTDCALDAVLGAHLDSRQRLSVVRQRGGRRAPLIHIFESAYLAALWDDLPTALWTYAYNSAIGLPVEGRRRTCTAQFAAVTTAAPEELRRLERQWKRWTPSLAAAARDGEGGSARATVAASARICGPVLLSPGVTVAEGARVGPWVVLEQGCAVGVGAWVERSVVGRQASLEPSACIYNSLVDAGVHVSAEVPVLKAHLHGGAVGLELLPGAEHERHLPHSYLIAKRALDLLLSLAVLALVVPFLLVIMCACLLIQGRPIFFSHERLGRHGRHFHMLKVRTMYRNAHLLSAPLAELESSPRFKIPDDPRITRFGRILRKTSVDELPQLFNVIRGQMSIIGPRPIVPKEALRYGIYTADLVRVAPGVTGLWQVNGRTDTTYAQRVMLDIKYGDTCSLWQDLRILVATVPAVLFLRGAE